MSIKRLRGFTIKQRFEDKYLVDDKSGCWNWTDSRDEFGRGGMTINKARKLAHRISYELHVGIIPHGMVVCHKCDNPSCVNPNHLFIGTQQDNLKDMRQKNRHVIGPKNKRSKLSDSMVIAIRDARQCGFSVTAISVYLKMPSGTVSKAINKQTWKHV